MSGLAAPHYLGEFGPLLAAIVNSSNEAIIGKRLDGTIVSWNPSAERIFGYSAAEAIGRSIYTLAPPDLVEEEREILARLAQGEVIRHYETERIRKDGQRIPIALSLSPIRDEWGEVIGAAAISREITMEKRAQETQARLALIVEGSDDAIISKSLEGTILSWNPGAERIFGYTAAQIVGRPIYTIIPPELHEEERRILDQLVRGQRVDHYLTKRVRKDGQRIAIELSISPVRDRDGGVIGVAAIQRDVTARQNAEAERQRLHQEAEEARAEIRRYAQTLELRVAERTRELQESVDKLAAFCYSVSHDLRAPLRAIHGYTEALLDDSAESLNQVGREYFRRIIKSARGMEQLINDLLELSRLGRAPLERQAVPLLTVVREALTQVDTEMAGATVEIEPELDETWAVTAHFRTLVQIVANLLSNGAKFVAPGVTPRVHVGVEQNEARVRLKVKDNGIGIARQYQERIFRGFERLHRTEQYPGTGVGLAIVRSGIERMGGRVGVESEPGVGSVFWIELPRAQGDAVRD